MMYFWEINRKDMHNHNLVRFKSNLFFFSIFGFYAGCVFVDCVFVHFSKCISIAKRGTFINLKYILFFSDFSYVVLCPTKMSPSTPFFSSNS